MYLFKLIYSAWRRARLLGFSWFTPASPSKFSSYVYSALPNILFNLFIASYFAIWCCNV